ncbi:MAG: hypothetical protein EDQ89_06990 [Acidobacteria bacterium]|nr:MAG: hypothetical protein EDQ89_06990 [Acidobacteriota bacterium]
MVREAHAGVADRAGESEAAPHRQRPGGERPGELAEDGASADRPQARIEGDADADHRAGAASGEDAGAVAAARGDDAGERQRVDRGAVAAPARPDRAGQGIVEEGGVEDPGGGGLAAGDRSELEGFRTGPPGAQPIGPA